MYPNSTWLISSTTQKISQTKGGESADERKRVLGLFLEAIKEANVIPVSAAVSLRDFNGLTNGVRWRECLWRGEFFRKKCSELTSFGWCSPGKIFLLKPQLTSKQILAVPCPTCGVAPDEKCELSTGQPRFEPHQARRLNASDKVDGKSAYARQKERKLQKILARINGHNKPL
jgi:hypothetical protein